MEHRLRVYNTLTRQKEPFEPLAPGKVGMYVCGPTVYKPSHIGHMVGPVIFDTVKRYLTYLGYEVTLVVNITDVDDKLIVRARELGTTVKELAEKMTADYIACLKMLNVTGIDHMPKATEHIAEMIDIIAGPDRQGLCLRGRRRCLLRRDAAIPTTASCATAIRSSWRPARASRSATRNATPATSPSGKAPSPASRRGTARGARAGPAGTSNARR